MATDAAPLSIGARWAITLTSVGVTSSSFLFINGVAFLIPSLVAKRQIPLAEAALLASMPSWGMVVTLVLWGYLADRLGERLVMTMGSALTAAAAFCAASAHSLVAMGAFLFTGGMAAASSNAAGGRLASGWFPPDRRGLAMGIRQTAQPLGIAWGASVIPGLTEHSPRSGLMFIAAVCTTSAVASAIGIVDPPRKPRQAASDQELASPYLGASTLWRIHAVSALLMMPQTTTVTFMMVWLMHDHGWSAAAAGSAVTVSQLLGALGRILVGRWSDRIGSRMRPVRIIAIIAAAVLFLLALFDSASSRYGVLLMITISVIAVLDNGLAATAITEFAGPFWSGRALGIQNTAQRLMAAAAPPLFGALVAAAQYPLAWASCGLFPLLAAPLVPVGLLPTAPTPARGQRLDADINPIHGFEKAVP
jgi:MFS family permease